MVCNYSQRNVKKHCNFLSNIERKKNLILLRKRHIKVLLVVCSLRSHSSNLPAKAEILPTLRGQFVGTSLKTDVPLPAGFDLLLGKTSFIFLCYLRSKGGAAITFTLGLHSVPKNNNMKKRKRTIKIKKILKKKFFSFFCYPLLFLFSLAKKG